MNECNKSIEQKVYELDDQRRVLRDDLQDWKDAGGGVRRVCRACERIRYRMALGWTEEEAETTPVIPPGMPTKRRTFRRAA